MNDTKIDLASLCTTEHGYTVLDEDDDDPVATRPQTAIPSRRGASVAAKEEMFAATDTDFAPWIVVKSNDEQRARINAIRHLLSKFDYDDTDHDVATEPDSQLVGRALED